MQDRQPEDEDADEEEEEWGLAHRYWGEVFTAKEDGEIDGKEVRAGQVVGTQVNGVWADGAMGSRVVVVGGSRHDAAMALLLDVQKREIENTGGALIDAVVQLEYGGDVTQAEAEVLVGAIEETYGEIVSPFGWEVELAPSHDPNIHYTIMVSEWDNQADEFGTNE